MPDQTIPERGRSYPVEGEAVIDGHKPYIPSGVECCHTYSEDGHAVLVYPDRLSEMPPGGVRVPLGLFPPDDGAILRLAPLTLIVRRTDV